MPAANPILMRSAAGGASPGGTPPTAPAAPTPPTTAGGFVTSITGGRVPVHVGALVLSALAVIVLLHLGGFRFVFDVGMGKR